MNPAPDRPRVRIGSPAAVLALVPYLLGFTPESSLVVLGTGPRRGQAPVAFRYDLPDPPDAGLAAEIAGHACDTLARQDVTGTVAIGYGPGRLVTPLADAIRSAAPARGLNFKDVLRVEDGRYWSYLCKQPSCCPAEGVPFDTAAHPVARVLAGTGQQVFPSRAALAATIAPVTGSAATEMAAATRAALSAARELIFRDGPDALTAPGLDAVRNAIRLYRDGGTLSAPSRHAWLSLFLTSLRIRDDAWARMDPGHHDAHRRLWADVTRHAQPGYIAAPASLLAFTCWQGGDGALANIAVDRALADKPGYSLALLLRDTLNAGAPPSMARLPMTPEQVAASYDRPGRGRHRGGANAGG